MHHRLNSFKQRVQCSLVLLGLDTCHWERTEASNLQDFTKHSMNRETEAAVVRDWSMWVCMAFWARV